MTVKAPLIKPGDRIDGREVRHVTGRKPRSTTNIKTPGRIPAFNISGHVVCVYFTDDGPPKYLYGQQSIEVNR